MLHEPNPMALLAYAIARPRHRLVIWYHSEVIRPRWRYKLIYEPFLKVPFRRASRIVVSSPALVEHAEALAPHRQPLRGHSLRPRHRADARARRASVGAGVRAQWRGPVALFVGRLVPYKGVDVLLRALRDVDVAAVIIGDGPLRAALESAGGAARHRSRDVLSRGVDDDAVAAWYAAPATCSCCRR